MSDTDTCTRQFPETLIEEAARLDRNVKAQIAHNQHVIDLENERIELIAALAEALEEIQLTDKLWLDTLAVVKLIPECSAHGPGCLPNARMWIEEMLEESNGDE